MASGMMAPKAVLNAHTNLQVDPEPTPERTIVDRPADMLAHTTRRMVEYELPRFSLGSDRYVRCTKGYVRCTEEQERYLMDIVTSTFIAEFDNLHVRAFGAAEGHMSMLTLEDVALSEDDMEMAVVRGAMVGAAAGNLAVSGAACASGTAAGTGLLGLGILIAHPLGLAAGCVAGAAAAAYHCSEKKSTAYLRFRGDYSFIVGNQKQAAMLEFQGAIAQRLAKFEVKPSDVEVVDLRGGSICVGLAAIGHILVSIGNSLITVATNAPVIAANCVVM